MNAFAWPLSTAALLLIIFVILLLRFPEEMRAAIRPLRRVRISPEGLALEFMHRAVAAKEQAPPRPGLKAAARSLRRARVLWVDDHPESNRFEAQAFRALGGEVDFATSNAEAVSYARTNRYDVIISDVGRDPPQGPCDGLLLPGRLAEVADAPPLVYYTGNPAWRAEAAGHPVCLSPSELFAAVGEIVGGLHRG